MTESTATVAQDLQRLAAAAVSKPEKATGELPLASLRDGQLALAIPREGQLELTMPPD